MALLSCAPFFFLSAVVGKAAFLFECSLGQISEVEKLASVLAYDAHLLFFGFPSGIIR